TAREGAVGGGCYPPPRGSCPCFPIPARCTPGACTSATAARAPTKEIQLATPLVPSQQPCRRAAVDRDCRSAAPRTPCRNARGRPVRGRRPGQGAPPARKPRRPWPQAPCLRHVRRQGREDRREAEGRRQAEGRREAAAAAQTRTAAA